MTTYGSNTQRWPAPEHHYQENPGKGSSLLFLGLVETQDTGGGLQTQEDGERFLHE